MKQPPLSYYYSSFQLSPAFTHTVFYFKYFLSKMLGEFDHIWLKSTFVLVEEEFDIFENQFTL